MSRENTIVATKRLILRQWRAEDLEPFAKLNADPRVMEFFPGLISKEESNAFIKDCFQHIDQWGWGLWAVSLVQTGEFVGFIGLREVSFKAAFTPAVEIGWRLAYEYWGNGYATEGAKATLRYGFEKLHLDEIVSFTVPANMRSRAVMEKIGMNRDPKGDFDHPKVPEGHILKRHVLYRIKANEYRSP